MGTAMLTADTMAIIVPISIEDALRAIHAKFAEAERHDSKANDARLAAGRMLIALRKRIESGEVGEVGWWNWYESNFTRSRKDAEKVMRLASAEDPEAAVEAERAATRKRMQVRRAPARAEMERTVRSNGHDPGRTLEATEEDDVIILCNRAFRAEQLAKQNNAMLDAASSRFATDELVEQTKAAMEAWYTSYQLALRLKP
jgi:hypothetical protein